MSARPRIHDLEQALLDLPASVVGEILFGRLVTRPRPASKHDYATTALTASLDPPFRRGVGGPAGWTFIVEPEVQLGPHVLVPDLAGWRMDTMPECPDVARFTVVPDWVCEVLSPGSERFDRDEKMLVYGANGVDHLWLLDPRSRVVEAYRSQHGRWEAIGRFEGDEHARIAPFDAVELALEWLWPSPVRERTRI